MVFERGHEIGSRGLNHLVEEAFDILPFDIQVVHLQESKKIIGDISGRQVVSFLAQAAKTS